MYNIGNRGCCSNSIHLQAPVSRLQSVLHTQSRHVNIQFASPHPSSPKHMHPLRHTQHLIGIDRPTVFVEQKVVHLWAIWRVISQNNFTRWWCALTFYAQRQPANHSVLDLLHLPNLALFPPLVLGSSENIEAYSHPR